jgi:hypothetical protein
VLFNTVCFYLYYPLTYSISGRHDQEVRIRLGIDIADRTAPEWKSDDRTAGWGAFVGMTGGSPITICRTM